MSLDSPFFTAIQFAGNIKSDDSLCAIIFYRTTWALQLDYTPVDLVAKYGIAYSTITVSFGNKEIVKYEKWGTYLYLNICRTPKWSVYDSFLSID